MLSPDELLAESSDDSDVVELETADPATIARERFFQKTAITKSENVSKRTRVDRELKWPSVPKHGCWSSQMNRSKATVAS